MGAYAENKERAKQVAVFIMVLGLVLSIEGGVFAQGTGSCKEDVAKFCKDVRPGGGRIAKCLKKHESELSVSCREKIAQVKEQVQEFREACKGDVDAFCRDIQPGGGRIVKCLKMHVSELSPSCKEAIAQIKARRK